MPRMPFRKKSTPRAPVTGTSYQAEGNVSPTTTAASLGELGSQITTKLYDPVPVLGNPYAAHQTYTKMARADASVRISLRAGKSPVLGADYYFEPCDDSPEAEMNKLFADYCLFRGMSSPFLKVMEQILKMYENGWSLFEPVWELREWTPPPVEGVQPNRRKYTLLKKLAVRPVSTIGKINYDDNGGPKEFEHKAMRSDGRADEVVIPIEKAIVFTFDQDGGDVTGNSILRSAYQHWYFKDHLYKIDAIQKERHGIGIPEVVLQPGYSAADKNIADEIASNLRTNEKAFVVRNTMMSIGFIELGVHPVDVLNSAQHHDGMIMKNIMVQFLNMGLGDTSGGRATGATAMDMFLKSMRYIAQTICDAFNMYLVPQMISYNFKNDKFPELRVKNIGETKDLQMWASAVSNLVKQGAIQVDDDFEQWVRANVDAPKRQAGFVEKTKQTGTNSGDPNQGNKGGGKNSGSGYVGKSESSGI
jgi:hypothetical protein